MTEYVKTTTEIKVPFGDWLAALEVVTEVQQVIGDVTKALRSHIGQSRADMADDVGITPSKLANIEAGGYADVDQIVSLLSHFQRQTERPALSVAGGDAA